MKKSFITGLIVLLPIAVTILIISFLLNIFTSPFLDLVTTFLMKFQKSFPLFASENFVNIFSRLVILVLFFFAIILLGMLGHLVIFKALLKYFNAVLMKIPLFKSIYHTLKDFITSIFSIDERKAFKYPVLVPFPSKDSYCVGFSTGTTPPECEEATNKKLEPVFVPTAPHPISGYLYFLESKDVDKIDMTNEEAIKFTVSCGVITPETKKEFNES